MHAKKDKEFTAVSNKFKVLNYSTVCFDLSRLEKHGSSLYRGYNYIENDLKGIELAGGSSYRGLKLPRVKLQ